MSEENKDVEFVDEAEFFAKLDKQIDEKMAPFATRQNEMQAMLDRQPKTRAEKVRNFGQLVRAFAAAKGDPERAAKIAKDKFGNDVVSKSLASNDFSAGGAFVPEDMSSEVIERLQAQAVVRQAGVTVYPMPNGTLTLPKVTGGATAAYTGEATAVNASEPTTGQIKLSFKKLVAKVPVTNELMLMASPQVDEVITRDTVRALMNAEDTAFLRGAGTENAPKGMRNWAHADNILSSNATSAANTQAANIETDFQELLQALGNNNVDMAGGRFIMSFRSLSNLSKLRDNNSGQLIFPGLHDARKTIMSYPVLVTNNLPINLGGGSNETEVYFVNGPDAVIGETSALEVSTSDEASYADSTGTLVSAFDRDETVIKIIARHDFAMRYDRAVAVMTGVLY